MLDPITYGLASLMKRFGGAASLVTLGEPAYDPETSTVTASETVYTVTAMMLDYVKKNDGDMAMGNALIRTGDKQVFVKPVTGLPKPRPETDKIDMQGKRYRIIVVKEINPSGTNPVLYELFVRE